MTNNEVKAEDILRIADELRELRTVEEFLRLGERTRFLIACLLKYGDHAKRCGVSINGTCDCGWPELEEGLSR